MIIDTITKELKEKAMKRDTDLSIDNEEIKDPGEPTYQEPKGNSGKDSIYNGSLCRGYSGSKEHPRG